MGRRTLTGVPYNTTNSVVQALVAQLAAGSPLSLTFMTALFYPAVYAGRNAPVVMGNVVFPLIVLAEGWTCFLEIVRARRRRSCSGSSRRPLAAPEDILMSFACRPASSFFFFSLSLSLLTCLPPPPPFFIIPPVHQPLSLLLAPSPCLRQYEPIIYHLVSHGMVVLVPLTNDFAELPTVQYSFPLHVQQILSAVDYFEKTNAVPGAEFFRRIAFDKIGLFGHSAGSGTALQAAAESNRFKAVMLTGMWAKNVTLPSYKSLRRQVTAPLFFLSGESDSRAPVEENTDLILPNVGSPHIHAVLSGGTHCFIRFE